MKKSKVFNKKNKKLLFSIIFESIIIIIGNVGVFLISGLFTNDFKPIMFSYFTIISNLLCIFYLTGKIIYKILNFNKKDKEFMPRYKGMILQSILVTMLIYIFLLSNKFSMNPEDLPSIKVANICLHYLLPSMMFIDYFIFDKKGSYKKNDPFLWITIPYIYFIYIVFMATFKILNFGTGHEISYFPYPFIDINKLGFKTVIFNVIIITIIFILIGYVIYIFDNKMKKEK